MVPFISFLQSLPYLFQIILKFMIVVEKFVTWAKDKNLSGWIDELEGTIDELTQADTPEKKRNSAGKIGDLIRRLK